jgi:hypothetical protein
VAVPGTQIEPKGALAVVAIALNAPAALGDDLFVTVPSYGTQRSHVVGWAPRTPLPQPGDECLVVYDEHRNPWVAAWLGAGGASSPLVSALPAEPEDGREVYYQTVAMAAQGVVWHLRFNAESASAHKWELLGGTDYSAEGSLVQEPAMGEGGTAIFPSILVPLSGDYDVLAETTIVNPTADSQLRFSVGSYLGAALRVATQALSTFRLTKATQYGQLTHRGRLIGAVAGDSVKPIVSAFPPVTAQVFAAQLYMRPVRVG